MRRLVKKLTLTVDELGTRNAWETEAYDQRLIPLHHRAVTGRLTCVTRVYKKDSNRSVPIV